MHSCEFLFLISLCDLLPHRISSLQLVGAEISCFSELWNKTVAQTAASSVLGLITTGLISTVLHRFLHMFFPSHSLLPLRMAFFLRMGRMNKWKINLIKAGDRSTTARLGSASFLGFFFWILRINIECPGIHLLQQLRMPKHLLFITDLVQNLLLIYLYLEPTESVILCASN